MEHIAIDLGSRKSQVCVRAADGEIVDEKRMGTEELAGYLSRRAPGRVVVETCAESFHVAAQAKQAGHEVRVVPATLVRSLGVGARRTKTDRRDAQVLSEVSSRIDLQSVHIPSERSQRWRAMCGARDALVRASTQLSNSVRGWARTQGLRVQVHGPESLPGRVRMFNPPDYIEQMLVALEGVTAQIKLATKEMRRVANDDAVCTLLMTVPGVGPITAVRFVAALDETDRFKSAHFVQAYLGLVPGEHSSGERTQRTSITKAGSRAVRWTLVQAAWSARRHRPNDAMVVWSKQVEQRRGKFIAVVALARKLAGVPRWTPKSGH